MGMSNVSFPTGLETSHSLLESESALQVDYLTRTCDNCRMDVSLGAGDVLFGDKWYHARCWELLRSASPESSDQD